MDLLLCSNYQAYFPGYLAWASRKINRHKISTKVLGVLCLFILIKLKKKCRGSALHPHLEIRKLKLRGWIKENCYTNRTGRWLPNTFFFSRFFELTLLKWKATQRIQQPQLFSHTNLHVDNFSEQSKRCQWLWAPVQYSEGFSREKDLIKWCKWCLFSIILREKKTNKQTNKNGS